MTNIHTSEKVKTTRLTRKPAVGWFSLRMLVNTAIQALLTAVTGNRTSRREVLAALDVQGGNPYPLFDIACLHNSDELASNEDDAVWIDYIADLGDGFNATHSIAWLVGRDYVGLGQVSKPIPQPQPPDCMTEAQPDAFADTEHLLPGGSVTIFGGDLVYPYATQRMYQERTTGPYHAARPWQKVGDTYAGRMLFSIPGNHDWYDGLANFVHRFCQRGRWMGAWQVQQKRSYFALRLGHGFSIWGIDLATANDFDAAQLEYFRYQADHLEENEQVILCVPTPAWTDLDDQATAAKQSAGPSGDAWNAITLLINEVSNNSNRILNPARISVIIAGDAHHYVRHEAIAESDRAAMHLITCGGGGAFMLGTDAVPDLLQLSSGIKALKQASFPNYEESRSLRGGVFSMFYRYKCFCAALSVIMLSLTWLVNSASRALIGDAETTTATIASTALGAVQIGLWEVLSTVGKTLIYSPPLLMLTLAISAGFIGFASSSRGRKSPKWSAPVAGLLHFLAQITIAFVITALTLAILTQLGANLLVYVFLVPVLTVGISWPICGLTFSFYLWFSNTVYQLHEQEIYSSQSIEDWKSFLRLRLNAEGLTIYPIGLRKVSRDWHRSPPKRETDTDDKKTASTFLQRTLIKLRGKTMSFKVRKGTTNLLCPTKPLEPHLIERPITLKRRGSAV